MIVAPTACGGINAKGESCGVRAPLYPDGKCWHHSSHVTEVEREQRRRRAADARQRQAAADRGDVPAEVGTDLEALRSAYGSRPEAFLDEVLGVHHMWSG